MFTFKENIYNNNNNEKVVYSFNKVYELLQLNE